MRMIVVFAMLAAGPLWPSAFTIADLGGLGGTTAVGFRINNSGVTVGWATTAANDSHAFQPGTGDLTPAGASEAFAYGLNSGGVTVGTSYVGGQAHGTVWSGGNVVDLGAGTFGLAINDAGAVAGGNGHAFILANGQMRDLGTLAGGNWSAAYAVNAAGNAAGYSDIGGGAFQAFMWSAGSGITALGTLGGTNSYATAMNDAGQVAGHAALASGYEHAFVWSGGVMTDLGTLGGNSFAYDINKGGDVVGYSSLANGKSHAFLERKGSLVDLNSLLGAGTGWELIAAYGINDAGQIVGTGLFQGQQRVFRLDPTQILGVVDSAIPEPGGVALAALGVGLLVLIRRSRVS
jgi:probable HAF family extracellular repeat protein